LAQNLAYQNAFLGWAPPGLQAPLGAYIIAPDAL